MDLSILLPSLLAEPGVPCVRVRVGPDYDDVIEVDTAQLEDVKGHLLYAMSTLGDVTASDWEALRVHTGGNGMMAKLLIGLGHLLKVWEAYPDPMSPPEMWNRRHPRVFRMAETAIPSRVPKPSRGDLETGTVACESCAMPMGPVGSDIHDLRASSNAPKICELCYEDRQENAPEGLDRFLGQFED